MGRLMILLAVGLGLLAAGCSTHADRLSSVREAFFSGNVEVARAKIDENIKKHSGEADALELDRASILLSEGKVRDAEQTLRKVRDHFDHLEQKDIGEAALSMLTDDQKLAYSGEDHEKVLVRVYLALASVLGDEADATAYALQIAAKQQQIIQAGTGPDGANPKKNYGQVAIGPYLHAALREQTHQNYDDAARSLHLVCAWAPEFNTGKVDLERVKSGRHSREKHGVLYLVTLVGRGPYKEERYEVASSAALLIADRILSATGKHTLPPTVAPIKVPRIIVPLNEVQTVRLKIDGQDCGHTETITDVGRLAQQQAEAMFPYVLARAVARRVVKKAAVYGAKEAMGKKDKDGLTSLALDVAGVVWEATESADTRCWGLLPDKVQVLRVELPVGSHQIDLQALGVQGSPRGPSASSTIEIVDGRNTYVLANFPTGRLVGDVVCSQKANGVR